MERNFSTIDKMLIFTLFLFTASSMFSISISQITAGVGGFLWLLRTYLTNTWKEQRWPLRVPVLLFALASLVAVANAYDVSYSYSSLKKTLGVSNLFLGTKLCPGKQLKKLSVPYPNSLCNNCKLIWFLSNLASI